MWAHFLFPLDPAPRAELTGSVGWTFSDGVSSAGIVAADGNLYDRIDPKDAFSYGFSLGSS